MSTSTKCATLLAVWLAAALGVSGPVAAQTGFEQVLPADTLIFVGCADIDGLRSGLAHSRVGSLLADPASGELREWLDDMLDRMDEVARHVVGAGTLEFASLLHGRFALAAIGRPRVDMEHVEGVALVLLADTGSDQDDAADFLDRLADGLAPWLGGTPRLESVDGSDVRTVPGDGAPFHVRVRLALHGSTIVAVVELLPMATDVLATLLEGLDRPPADGLAAAPQFRGTLAAGPGGGVQAWMDADRVWEAVKKGVPTYITSLLEKVRPVIECKHLGCLALRSTFEPSGLRTRTTYEFALDGPGTDVIQAARPSAWSRLLSAAPADASQISVGAFDMPRLFKGVIASVEAGQFASAAQVNDFIGQVEAALGEPLDTLIDALDGEWAFIIGPAGQPGTLGAQFTQGHQVATLLGLQDAVPIERLASALARPDGPLTGFQAFELDGQPCFRFTRWTITASGSVQPKFLALATSEELLADVLRQARSPDSGSIADDARLRERLAALSPGWTGLEVTNIAGSILDLFASLAQWKGILALAPDRAQFGWLSTVFDAPAPDPELLQRHLGGWNVTVSTLTHEGSRSESLQY